MRRTWGILDQSFDRPRPNAIISFLLASRNHDGHLRAKGSRFCARTGGGRYTGSTHPQPGLTIISRDVSAFCFSFWSPVMILVPRRKGSKTRHRMKQLTMHHQQYPLANLDYSVGQWMMSAGRADATCPRGVIRLVAPTECYLPLCVVDGKMK